MGIGARSIGFGRAAIERQATQAASGRLMASMGGGGGGLQGIIKQMQAAQKKANLANEQRYQQILGSFENLGKAGRARIEEQTIQRQAQATQRLTSRGLGSTTITSAVERGIAGDAETQRQQLEESVTMQKAGVMERRTDTGPDLGMFASLLQSAGQQAAPQRSVIRTQAPRPQGADKWAFLRGTPSTTTRTRNRARFIPSRSGIRAGERPVSSVNIWKGASMFRPGV